MKFTGKSKVDNTTWAKLCGLIGQNKKKAVFSKPTQKMSASDKQESKQALGLAVFQAVILVEYPVLLVVRWLVWKQLFLPFITQPGPTFCPQGPNK